MTRVLAEALTLTTIPLTTYSLSAARTPTLTSSAIAHATNPVCLERARRLSTTNFQIPISNPGLLGVGSWLLGVAALFVSLGTTATPKWKRSPLELRVTILHLANLDHLVFRDVRERLPYAAGRPADFDLDDARRFAQANVLLERRCAE